MANIECRYVETRPEKHSLTKFSVCGLGIGLLASTAISLSSNVSDLALASADAVVLAFRLGVLVFGVSEDLEARDLSEKPETWAYVVHNVDLIAAQKELDSVHARAQIPNTGKVFISAISRSSVTISGPPSRLKKLLNKSEFFRKATVISLPVYGGVCHAPHIYGPQDAHGLVQNSPLNTVSSGAMPRLSVYSTSTGLPFAAKNAAQLFESVISEILMGAICWDKVITGVTDQINLSEVCEARLYGFGNAIPLSETMTALQKCYQNLAVSMHDLMHWIQDTPGDQIIPRGPSQSKLAIVGMSCRLPGGAASMDLFWEVLEKGLDVSRRIPADRFDIDTHYDPTGQQMNKSMTQYGCFIDEPGLFDAPFFNMSPRESQVVDPQMRLSLVTAYEALEQAGFVANRTASTQLQRIGTYYGQAADDYREVNQGQEVNTYYIPGGCRAFGPGRISYFFKFSGPSYSVDTACSSGLAAIEVSLHPIY